MSHYCYDPLRPKFHTEFGVGIALPISAILFPMQIDTGNYFRICMSLAERVAERLSSTCQLNSASFTRIGVLGAQSHPAMQSRSAIELSSNRNLRKAFSRALCTPMAWRKP
jgi:hypothetical protein